LVAAASSSFAADGSMKGLVEIDSDALGTHERKYDVITSRLYVEGGVVFAALPYNLQRTRTPHLCR
jgi:hypothetical protein